MVGAVVLAIAISESAYQRASTSLANLEHRTRALADLSTLLRDILDAEAGQRGYLLSGRKEHLQPYDWATEDVGRALRELSAHYRDDSIMQGILHKLTEHAEAKLSELKTTIELFDAGRHDAWHELILSNIGKEKLDAVREAAAAMLDIESGRIVAERANVLRTLRISRIGIVVLLVFGVLALLLYLRQARVAIVARQQHAKELLAERDRLEREATKRTAELTELTQHLQYAREDERGRLARELHDELGALLTAAKIDTARLKRIVADSPPAFAERLQHLGATLDAGIALKRRIIEDLHPSSLKNLGLCAALEIQAREFEARCEARAQLQLQEVALSDSAQITVYRLVQEALTNVAKYARASQVWLSVAPDGQAACVSVKDNGVGFDPGQAGPGSHGLTGMRYRVQAEGGRVRIDSSPGRGTLIEAWLPLRELADGG